MLVSEVAATLGYDMAGEDQKITGISFFNEAKENEIAVIFERDNIIKTKANTVLTKPTVIVTDKTLLITYESIELSVIRICNLMITHKMLNDYSVPVKQSLCEKGYYVGKDCAISDNTSIQHGVVIGNNVIIEENVVIDSFTVIGSGTIIKSNVHIGTGSNIGASSFYHYYDENDNLCSFCGKGIVIINSNSDIGCNTVIQRGTLSNTIIGQRCMIGNFVDIGHDVKIGDSCKIVSQTGIAGEVTIKNNVLIYGQVAIANKVTIGNNAVVMGRTGVSKSVKDNEIVCGPRGREYSSEMKMYGKMRNFFNRKEE